VRIAFPALINVEISEKSELAPSKKGASTPKPKNAKAGGRITLETIISAGLITAPFRLEVTFKKQNYEAEVQKDGSIIYQGKTYKTPSDAGKAVVERKACNGWSFWRYRDSDGEPQLLDELRKVFFAHQNG
jgi:hypothetical protein